MKQFNIIVVSFSVLLMQINCITCNSTLYTYLLLYYKMQVIFYAFRQRSDSARGGMFTLKILIKCLAMPIVVPLYSQPKISNSINQIHQNPLQNLRYHHSDKNQIISIKVSNHTSSKIPTKNQ